LNRTEEAASTLAQAMRWYPDDAAIRSSLALLYARLGQRDAAVKIADECLRAQPDRSTLYQLAGVFAAASRRHPQDGDRAIDLLTAAVQEGVSAGLLASDRGLDPIRKHPRFGVLLASAQDAERRSRGRLAVVAPRDVEE
jgi:tetratricopeptide (TPR) repeat protein